MKSLQSKLSLAIAVMMFAGSAALMITAMIRNRRIVDMDSSAVIQAKADYYALMLDNVIKDSSDNPEEALRSVVSQVQVYDDNYGFLAKKDGDIIYHRNYPEGIPHADLSGSELMKFDRILSQERDVAVWLSLNRIMPVKIVLKDLDNGYTFGILVPRFAFGKAQARLIGALFITSILIIVISIVLSLLWVKQIITPLKKMTLVADRYAKGDYSEKLTVGSKDEVGRLSNSLQSMANSLTEQIEIADSANRAKSNFLSNMSHEIRTPITAILGFNEMILRESDNSEITNYSKNIKNAGNTLLSLINDILDFSKIEDGKLSIIPVNYDISSLINDLVNMVKIRADEKGLSLVVDFDRNIPKYLFGDEIRIKQVVTNILTNAVKYTEKGSVTFHIGYEKDSEDPDSVLLDIYVKDTGIGIREEDLEKLFSKFERIDEKRNRNIEGTGLGMNITHSLLEMMDSTLNVESLYGVGSKFSFKLRQKVTGWEPLGDYEISCRDSFDEAERYSSSFTAPTAHILIVDDNETNLLVFKSLIKGTLMDVETATGGDEAVAHAGKVKYDIIFLDHMMPGKDGIETLHELQKMDDSPNNSTPIICLTANAISGAREEYISEGFIDYLTKPIDPSKLEEMMLKYLPKDKIDNPVNEKSIDTSNPSGSVKAVKTQNDFFDALSSSNILDVETGLLHCGSKETFFDILQTFYQSIDQNIETLNKLIDAKDIKNYTIRVHSVKSNCKTVGITKLGAMAEALEISLKNNDVDYALNNHAAFIAEYNNVKTKLSVYPSIAH